MLRNLRLLFAVLFVLSLECNMGFRGRLEITDGTTFIDLLGNATHSTFSLLEWEPSAPAPKGGGIWMDNPLLDGRQLAIRKESNIIDTFTIVAKGQTATDIHNAITTLRYMLNRAVGYWTNRARYPDPIYLLIQYPEESVPYWGLIYDYRMSNLTNPYTQPLYQSKRAVIPEFTLTVERSRRSPITGNQCAPLDIDYNLSAPIQYATFAMSISQDDASVNWTTQAINTATPAANLGLNVNTEEGYTARFRNITIPPGSTITKAYMIITSLGFDKNKPPAFYIASELNIAPAQYSNWANWIARTWSSEVALDGKDIDEAWQVDIPGYKITNAGGFENILQQVINLPGWVSGNDISLYIRNKILTRDFLRGIYTFDIGTPAWRPLLYIEWTRATHDIKIKNSNCTPVVMGNKDPFNSIGDVLVDNGGVFTNLKGTALPWTLLPAAPAVNDALYVACNFIDNDPQDMPFNSLVFNLSTVSTNGLITWEYWNGAAWTALTYNDLTQSFQALGQNTVNWPSPANWARTAVNGITAFWVRGRVATAPTVAPVQASEIYQSVRPYMDVLLSYYDNPLEYKLQINPVGSLGQNSDFSIDHVFICSRLKSRGEDFTPFLNLVDTLETLPPGISLSHPLGTDTQLNTAPTGRAIRYNPGGVVVETNAFTLFISSAISGQYSGRFRVFLRRYGATDPENISYRLTVSNNPTGLSPNYYQTGQIADTDNPSYSVVDFGTVDLTAFAMYYNDVYLTVSSEASAAADVYWIDLILLPVDDAAVEVYQRIGADVTAWFEGFYNRIITVDSISNNEEQAYFQEGGNIIAKLLFNSNTGLIMPVNREMRIWFFFGGYITGCTNYQRRYHPGIIAGVTLQILPEKI